MGGVTVVVLRGGTDRPEFVGAGGREQETDGNSRYCLSKDLIQPALCPRVKAVEARPSRNPTSERKGPRQTSAFRVSRVCSCARAGRASRGVRRCSQFPALLKRFKRSSICHPRGSDVRWRCGNLTTPWLEGVNIACFTPRIPDLPRFYPLSGNRMLSSAAAGACRGNVQRDSYQARPRPASHGGEDTALRECIRTSVRSQYVHIFELQKNVIL